jgi:hypothetical protein
MKCFRGGGYDRLYGTAVQEAREAIRLTEEGKPTPCIISEMLRDDDSLCFATFANFVAVPDKDKFCTYQDELPMPLYERVGVKNEVASVEARLVQAKRIIPKPQARVEADKARRISKYIFSSIDIVEDLKAQRDASFSRRKQISGALRGNTAYMNLLNRHGSKEDINALFRQGWKPCVSGQGEFSLEHARWLSKGARGKTLNIFDIPITQDMYLRSEVSIDESLKVGGIVLNVQGKTKWIPQRTITKVGLYEITSTMEEWCDEKVFQLTKKRDELRRPLTRPEILPIFVKDREWINDDSTLIELVIEATRDFGRETQVALVSSDRKLANNMCRQANVQIVLVDPTTLPGAFPDKVWNSHTEITNSEMYDVYPENRKSSRKLKEPLLVVLDTGSINSKLSKITVEESDSCDKVFYLTSLVASGHNNDGTRYEEVQKRTLYGTSKVGVRVYHPSNKDPFKVSRKPFGRDSGSVNSLSWNTGSESFSMPSRVVRRKKKDV